MRARHISCIAIAVVPVAAAGCESLYHLDEYSTADAAAPAAPLANDDGSPSRGLDASSAQPGDAGADQCANPLDGTFANACTSAICVPFDNVARIEGFSADAGPPPLPEASAPADAGTSGAGNVDGSPGDGGAEASSPGVPGCSSLPRPLFMIGSSGLTSVAAELGALASTIPITIVYTVAHSCDGAKAIIANETSFDTGAVTANYWDAAGTVHTCQLDAASAYADIGLGNLFAEECLPLPQGTSGIGDFLGPVTPGAVVAPTASTQSSISAEALYYVFGLAGGAVAPWTSSTYRFVNPSSGVQWDFGLDISVPASRWQGALVTSATQNVAKVATSTQPEETIGTMSTDLSEAATTSSAIKELAFKDYGQSCAYYANSTATSADKKNVRDGHYAIWGFTHMFTKVNAQGVPLGADAATVIGYFTGNLPTPTGSFLKYVISDHLVPVCAMTVTRSVEMGRLSPYTPSPGCGCYFDSIATGTSTCQTCATHAECPSAQPHCNLGYCEVN